MVLGLDEFVAVGPMDVVADVLEIEGLWEIGVIDHPFERVFPLGVISGVEKVRVELDQLPGVFRWGIKMCLGNTIFH